jgi:hypothetical protein
MGDSEPHHLEEVERGAALRMRHEWFNGSRREAHWFASGRNPEAAAPQPQDRGEEHRHQDGEVPAGGHGPMARVALFRRGVVRVHRARLGRMGRSLADTELMLETVDTVAQEQGHHQNDGHKPSGCRGREYPGSYAASL